MRRAALAFAILFAVLPAATLAALSSAQAAAPLVTPDLDTISNWSSRCFTDTCLGFAVTFASGATAVVGYAADFPRTWSIQEAIETSDDEFAFIQANADSLNTHDPGQLAAAYDDIPDWYTVALARYFAVPLEMPTTMPALTPSPTPPTQQNDAPDHVYLPLVEL